jgi:hypothetical protein
MQTLGVVYILTHMESHLGKRREISMIMEGDTWSVKMIVKMINS